jgi:hypothetical protein
MTASRRPSFVGANEADPKRPQVFNAKYLPFPDGRRSLGTSTDPKPWHVSLDSVTEKQFRRHAKAITYANKLARKRKK